MAARLTLVAATLASLAIVGTAQQTASCLDGDTCSTVSDPSPSQDSALLQMVVSQRSGRSNVSALHSAQGVTSDCARRFQDRKEANSACIVVRDGRALLVWVPYGSAPGWDLPGGRKKSREPRCETAERETCEESGIRVRAVKKLSYNVFQCEVVTYGACRNPVDEGFLKKRWVSRRELDGLQYRGGSWGDKRGLLKRALASRSSSTPRPQPGPADACGCGMCGGEGFSSGAQQCRAGKATDPGEACACLRRSGSSRVDACGCRPCDGEGWSTRERRCVAGAETSPEEGCQCKKDGASAPTPAGADVCGCDMCRGEGFSSGAQQCRPGKGTDTSEACDCLRRKGASGDALVDACGCRPCNGEGWSTTQRRCARGSDTSPEEGCQCRRDGRQTLAQIA